MNTKRPRSIPRAWSRKASSYEKERDVKISEIKQLQDKLNLLTEAEKEKQQKDLEDKVKAARDFTLTKETGLKKEGDDRLKEVAKDIEEATAQFAKKKAILQFLTIGYLPILIRLMMLPIKS